MFTKGLFIKSGCWGTTRGNTVTWGLVVVKLILLLGQKERGGNKQLSKPGEKEFFIIGCLESSNL